MSLAQTLLLDLDDDLEEIEGEEDSAANNSNAESQPKIGFHKENHAGQRSDDEKALEDIQSASNLQSTLLEDKKFLAFLENLNSITNSKNDVRDKFVVESKLYTKSNSYVQEVDEEMTKFHSKLVKVYSKRFPELASLIPDMIVYIRIVKELRNDILQTKYNEKLPEFLPNSLIIVISISAVSTKGKFLSEEDLHSCDQITQICDKLLESKAILENFVESRMSIIAPNLTNLLGPTISTKILSATGGLKNLMNIPSCNIHLIGAERQLTSTGAMSHSKTNGIVYESDIVLNINPDFIKHAIRQISNKISIASRCDFFQTTSSGQEGLRLREELLNRLQKIQEPLSQNQHGALDKKALPVPAEAPRRRRGGRRARKAKELMGMSEMRSQTNKMPFGQIGEDVNQAEIGKDYGTLSGNNKSGKVRGPVADAKTKAKVSKNMQQKLNKQNALAGSHFNKVGGNATSLRQQLQKTSGSASSVISFTPVQGLEIIVNPEGNGQSNSADKEDGYFLSTAQFKKPKRNF